MLACRNCVSTPYFPSTLILHSVVAFLATQELATAQKPLSSQTSADLRAALLRERCPPRAPPDDDLRRVAGREASRGVWGSKGRGGAGGRGGVTRPGHAAPACSSSDGTGMTQNVRMSSTDVCVCGAGGGPGRAAHVCSSRRGAGFNGMSMRLCPREDVRQCQL